MRVTRRSSTTYLFLCLLVLIGVAIPTAADASAPPGTPTARAFDGIPTVGPLFPAGLSTPHACTASVLDSATADLIITAAHCLTGTASGWQFAPGYDRGRTPYGVWTVTAAYLDQRWVQRQDTQFDYAILRVGHQQVKGQLRGLQDVTGGNELRLAPRIGLPITDVAYNAGINDQPITCTTPAYYTQRFPTFNCHGYVGGSSGSPWLARLPGSSKLAVRGVIGGLHQGGCFDYTSYSPLFTAAARQLLQRAVAGGHSDVAPAAGSDGC